MAESLEGYMIFPICQFCKEKGVIPDYDALLLMKTDDDVSLCGLCEQRIGTDTSFDEIHVRVRRIAREVYAVLSPIEPFLEMLSEQDRQLTLAFCKKTSRDEMSLILSCISSRTGENTTKL